MRSIRPGRAPKLVLRSHPWVTTKVPRMWIWGLQIRSSEQNNAQIYIPWKTRMDSFQRSPGNDWWATPCWALSTQASTWRPPNRVAGHGWTNYAATAWLKASPKRWRRKLHGLAWPSFGSHTESLPPHSVGCEGAQIQGGELWTRHLVRVMLWRSSLENTIWMAGGRKRTKQSSSYYLIGNNYNKRCFNQTPTDVEVITQKACFRLPQETQAASPTLGPATSSREREMGD